MIEQTAEEFRKSYSTVREELQKRIVGMPEVIDNVIDALFLSGHVLLEGVPGIGKTLLVKSLSEILDLNFSRVQFTPDLMPADILGTTLLMEAPGGQKVFEFQKGPVFTNVLLADEINRATPKTQSALLEAMQERAVTTGGNRYVLDPPFLVLATQNPLEMEGTYPLPEAQLDRFLYKILVPFPDENELVAILSRTTADESVQLQHAIKRGKISEYMHLILQVPVVENVLAHAARIVASTHPEHGAAPEPVRKYVRYGSSPRGAQALILSAKIRALKEGRFNASIDDVNGAILPSLRHRLILNVEGMAEGIAVDTLLASVLQEVTRK